MKKNKTSQYDGAPARDEFVAAYEDLGHKVPDSFSHERFVALVAGTYLPTEMPSLDDFRAGGLDKDDEVMIQKSLSQLTLQTNRPETLEQTDRLKAAIGRNLAAIVIQGQMEMNRMLVINRNTVRVGSLAVACSFENRSLIDWGMGLKGLLGHAENIKADHYHVHAVQPDRHEAGIIQGMAAELKIPEGRLTVSHDGIMASIDEIMESDKEEQADLVIASRVHMAGGDLLRGVRRADTLLRPGGLLVMNGPRVFSDGAGYEQIDRILARKDTLRMVDKNYYTGEDGVEDCSVTIYQKAV